EDKPQRMIEKLELELPTDQGEAENLIRRFQAEPPKDRTATADQIWIGAPTFRGGGAALYEEINLPGVLQTLLSGDAKNHRHYFSRLYTVRLDGRTRFALSDPKPTGDLQLHPQNHLWKLFVDDAARERVRNFSKEAFGLYFTVDPTAMSQFRIRMSARAPASPQEERGLDKDSQKFHAAATPIQDLSDGVQAFTGLTSALLSLPHTIILIDEPEAFLHPPLARRLGANLAKVAAERGASLVVSTHSAEFLMGCIETNIEVRIVRVTYNSNVATARSVASTDLKNLMKKPLLRSAQALRGIFHKGVIVTEGDTDRAFYEEINRRLMETGKGSDDTLFLNAQNWNTISRITKPLRNLGVPTAAIYDIDSIYETGQNWSAIFDMCVTEPTERVRLQELKEKARLGCNKVTRDICKKSGLNALEGQNRLDVEMFQKEMKKYGVFIVDVGELEAWLKGLLPSPVSKEGWLDAIFTALGDDPGGSEYTRAGDNDVWAFLEDVAGWIRDPNRLGVF
ncbi:MAG: AAA family ATPase, partial [Patescibacteria group bacterium]